MTRPGFWVSATPAPVIDRDNPYFQIGYLQGSLLAARRALECAARSLNDKRHAALIADLKHEIECATRALKETGAARL